MQVCGFTTYQIVNNMLNFVKINQKYPLISTLGVKIGVNTVNYPKIPLNFHSRHRIQTLPPHFQSGRVKIEKA